MKESTSARNIIHMDMDSFFVSVECRKNPKLKNLPLAVGGSSKRGVVASCSYEARKYGVHSAMPMLKAKQLCPQLVVVKGDIESYSRYSKMVTEIIADSAPLFEKSSIDEFYIDITGMDKFFGCYKWTHELRKKIMKETGLPISFGLSANKMLAKIATGEAKPNGEKVVPRGKELEFLNPMHVRKIPGIGKKTYANLAQIGIETIAELRQTPIQLLERFVGKNSGLELCRKANGIDESPVLSYHESKSISTENTFPEDVKDVKTLKEELASMTEKIAYQLRSENKLSACVTVKLRYPNFDTYTKQLHIAHTSTDHTLISHAQDLFERLYDKKNPVRLIGVKLSQLVYGNYQINLFDDVEKTVHLYQAMDRIRNKYGERKVQRAVGMHAEPAGIFIRG